MVDINQKSDFYPVPEKLDIPKEETRILKFWKDIKAFETSLKKSEGKKIYTFYDGPPFATGLPHYGHMCAGTIKDVITRYATQTGHYVERRFGWDCHGLPVEHEIDKKLEIKTKEDLKKIGIPKYNEECRSIVMRYSSEWRETVEKMGRWIDFDNDYKTLDIKFMESCWWVFKQMYEKGLVYRGCKIMPYSNACNTVLSNFEANQNYQEVFDPSIYITFPLLSDPSVKLVAWTTTPWTLPSNLALAVNPLFDYVKIKDIATNEIYILAECRLEDLYPKGKGKEKEKYQLLEKFKGKTLENLEYEPIFPFFPAKRQDGCYKVLCGDFITDDTGTGVVHCAPAYGADDYKICCQYNIIKPDDPLNPIDDSGYFTKDVPPFAGMYIKDADKEIKKDLKSRGKLIHESQIKHSYPFCWRSDTPLIYKAQHCWFFKVKSLKEDLIKNNKKSYWVPTFAQEGRFNNWLENAEDWCFSRSRCWGNPIPLWVSDDYSEIVCVGSIEELKKLTGVTEVTDLHRENIDHLTIPSSKGNGVLRRIEEVFDCWFESGSMPYAQVHYPFSMKEEDFQKRFPADFIGEGLDQTRGWFYTLNVISTALRNDTPYRNLIVNGLVLASNGKKMSKSKKNYTPVNEVIAVLGADPIRLYLINSPLVRAEPLCFKDEGVHAVVRDIFLPWYNAYRFLIQNIGRWEAKNNKRFIFDEELCHKNERLTNFIDRWILTANQSLIKLVRTEMEKYRLYTNVPKLVEFLEQLTNWYVRLNRGRIKGENGNEEWTMSLNVLFDVLLKSTILMSPFVPFICESMYQNMRKVIHSSSSFFEESIHFLQIPQSLEHLHNQEIEDCVTRMQKIIELARKLRETKKVSLKQPIKSMMIINKSTAFLDSLKPVISLIEDEINTPSILLSTDFEKYVVYQVLPNNKDLGLRLKDKFNKKLIDAIKAMTPDQINLYKQSGKVTINEVELSAQTNDLIIKEKYMSENLDANLALGGEDEICLLLDVSQDEKLRNVGIVREVVNRVQKLRKNAGLNVDDPIAIFYDLKNNAEKIGVAIQNEKALADQTIKKPFNQATLIPENAIVIKRETYEWESMSYEIIIIHNNTFYINLESLKKKFGEKSKVVYNWLAGYNSKFLKSIIEKNGGVLKGILDEKNVELVINEDFVLF